MAKILKIGVVGCGAIGSSLAGIIKKDFSDSAELAALYDIDQSKSSGLSEALCGSVRLKVKDLALLISKCDLVIETSSARCSAEIARSVLSEGRSVMVMSVGGVLDDFKNLYDLAKKSGAKLYIPSGAIAGIDALKALNCSKIESVTLTTKKPPKAFHGVAYVTENKIDLEGLKEDKVIFEGDCLAATKAFPQNINVAATLSIAGIGPERTRVRIVASPSITKNIHEVRIESEAGSVVTQTENTIHPANPKTSYLAVLSAVAVLKNILEPVRVGA